MSTDDKKWINNLSQHYQWPQPSHELRSKILNGAKRSQRKHQQPKKMDYLAKISNILPKWEPALAMACTLVLGICIGTFTIPNKASAQAQTDIYIDADTAFIHTTINQKGGLYSE